MNYIYLKYFLRNKLFINYINKIILYGYEKIIINLKILKNIIFIII